MEDLRFFFRNLFFKCLDSIRYRRQGSIKLRDLLEAAEIPEASLEPDVLALLDHPVKLVSFIKKRMVPDCLAFGLYREKLEYMKQAKRLGAFACVVKEKFDIGIPCIVVPDPLLTYGKMCAKYRELFPDIGVTAVTGSIGKTSVKNMISTVYREQFRTLTEPLNENEPHIVGFSVQHLSKRIDQWVQEVAESVPGTTKTISLMMKPNVVIITELDRSHIGRLGSMDTIFDEVCNLADSLAEDGIVVVHKNAFNALDRLEGKKIVFVSESDDSADYYARDIEVREDGLHYTIVDGGSAVPVHLKNIFARHNVLNSLYAYAAGRHAGLSPQTIACGLGKYKTTGFRNNVYKSQEGDTIYADCFNAVGRSIRSALDAASAIPIAENAKRIAILGDVQELGDEAAAEHLSILKDVNQANIDRLLLIGDQFHAAAKDFPFRQDLAVSYPDSIDEIVRTLKPSLSQGNLYLFKASHSGHLDQCIKKLWPRMFEEKDREERRMKRHWKLQMLIP